MPRISFILPVYNPKEAILERCCKGLLAQSLIDFEAIFILDGPSELARSVIKRTFKKKDNYKIVEIEHGGACRARNEGAKYAQGDIWCFFDSDCEIECDAAQAWVDLFDRKPEIGFVYAGYRFFEEKGGYGSEPFDPWLLRVNNYISTCFPFRKELFQGWNEELESLQDWDFWLKVVEKGAVGHYMLGYAFSTAAPTAESISGKGCTNEKWLERIDKVKQLHGIPDKSVCVASLTDRHEGIRLAKMIDADYRDFPTRNPHKYKSIIQIGFSFEPGLATECSGIFNDSKVKNYLFWTRDSIYQAYTMLSRKALVDYSERLNKACIQFCEDKEAQRILELCGFHASILPLPFENPDSVSQLPEQPKFLVDSSPHYGQVLSVLEKSLPDIKFEVAANAQKIEDYTGLLHFHAEPTMSNSVKRMLISGRYVVSNIQQPFAGYIDDHQAPDTFIPKMVDKLRSFTKPNENAREYYLKMLSPEKLKERVNA